jgi:plastocyanin
VAERSNAAVSKTVSGFWVRRGFKSLPLRFFSRSLHRSAVGCEGEPAAVADSDLLQLKGSHMRRLLLVLVATGALAAVVVSTAVAATPSVVHLSAPVSGLRYDQKVVHAHAGRIKIVFLNRAMMKHNVNVELGEHELGHSATIMKGTTTFFVTLKPGSYNFYCSVPGHEDAGMHGTLIVS